MMDSKWAAVFKQHVERSIEQLSLALTLAEEACEDQEFLRFRGTIGDVIARLDAMLQCRRAD
ncbi:hypothetical protein [Bradyrhizobium aeschynomenes]|uniref:hypothetical protein n=1 Tax=Bradyrhizobium aeschynomenes TaxID=2734909 RepID=UPI001FED5313|nr:hypothetical protein [Bradyrhizobium aeschynomenes]